MTNAKVSNIKTRTASDDKPFADLKIDWGYIDERWAEDFLEEFISFYFADFTAALSRQDKRFFPTIRNSADVLTTLRQFVGKPHSCRDWDIYHKYITKPIFDDGWGGVYAIMILSLGEDKTLQELRVEMARWIITHWDYLNASYQEHTFTEYAGRYGNLGDFALTKFPEENSLRDKLLELSGLSTNKGKAQKLQPVFAVESFQNLNEAQIKRLKRIARHACVFSAHTSYIDNAILPTMYDYQLFTGSDYLLDDLKMLERDTDIRVKRLDIEKTLLLITSALAGGNPGAEYWYRRRITGKLFQHLIDLSKTNDATVITA